MRLRACLFVAITVVCLVVVLVALQVHRPAPKSRIKLRSTISSRPEEPATDVKESSRGLEALHAAADDDRSGVSLEGAKHTYSLTDLRYPKSLKFISDRTLKTLSQVNKQTITRPECRCPSYKQLPPWSPTEQLETSETLRILYFITVYSPNEMPALDRLLSRLRWPGSVMFLVHFDHEASPRDYEAVEEHLRPMSDVVFMKRENTVGTKRFTAGLALVNILLMRRALMLRDHFAWEYVINLTPSTYPLQSPRRIAARLRQSKSAVFMECQGWEVDKPNAREKLRRLMRMRVDSPFGFTWQMPRVAQRRVPTDMCFGYGSAYFAMPFDVVLWILLSPMAARVQAFLHNVEVPDEFIMQSLVLNSPFKAQLARPVVFVTWPESNPNCVLQAGEGHPCLLSDSDFPALEAAVNEGALFARKIDTERSAGLLTHIDKALGRRRL